MQPVEGEALRAIEALAARMGSEAVLQECRALASRLSEGLFFVACVGQFKRGKSSLVNALVGHDVLPVGVIPVTSIVTIVQHGAAPCARVLKLDASHWEEVPVSDLPRYVTESENPHNSRRVAAVKVLVGAPLLAGGMCLVDTPGIGSVFGGNTETTRRFVPHVDAALVVVGADPPITEGELALLTEIGQHTRELVIALNKADRVPPAEAEEAARFTAKVVEDHLARAVGPILLVSALERRQGTPTRDWTELEGRLETLARTSGAQLAARGVRRGVARLARALCDLATGERLALARPLEESEARLAALAALVGEGDRALSDLSYLFAAEQDRLVRTLGQERDEWLRHSAPEARAELEQRLVTSRATDLESAVRDARHIARRAIEAWLPERQVRAAALYAEATRRFVDLARTQLARQRALDAPEAGSGDLEIEPALTARSRFYFHDLQELSPSRGWLGWASWGLVPDTAHEGSRRAIADHLEQLLNVNATRVQNDLEERIAESRRQLEIEVRALVRSNLEVARGALERARTHVGRGHEAVDARVAELDRMAEEAQALEDAVARENPASSHHP